MPFDINLAVPTFICGNWQQQIDVRNFIQLNYTPYHGDGEFLASATDATKTLWKSVYQGIQQENSSHAPLDFDNEIASNITSHPAGYIDQHLEKIVGLQTDKPLKRPIICDGGIRMVEQSCQLYGKPLAPNIKEAFTRYKKTHNQAVFDVYTSGAKKCRKSGVITGLPDAYGRGRIIGDYRRVALYGIDKLINAKKQEQQQQLQQLDKVIDSASFEQAVRLSEEVAEQVKALTDMKTMALKYGVDISKPAQTAQQAIQWTYFGYLAAIKSQNGAAMSLGRVSTFFDIYIERELTQGTLTESQAQELIDHFVMKLRMVRFLRTPEYDELFSGDPIWATEALGGMGLDGRTLVTKTTFRMLHSLYTMGASPEPNLTVLWSDKLPEKFKHFCAKVSIETSSIQYESDDLMRSTFASDDYAIACCVSPMVLGKQMQFFGARANLAKTLLLAINGGKDELSNEQIAPEMPSLSGSTLDYQQVEQQLFKLIDWLAGQYVTALNSIHYMHDKYAYEAALMALHDKDVERSMACGIAGLSVVADSLAAIKYAKVTPIVNEHGLTTGFNKEGDAPCFGNNDARVDDIACQLVERFMAAIKKYPMYRNATPTQSVLTITSNVVYGKKTGATPDGRQLGQPFAPGANPMHGRDQKGAVASLASVSKIPFASAQDGVSYTFSVVPKTLGTSIDVQSKQLSSLLDGYFFHDENHEGGQHINVNVLDKKTLIDAMNHPERYPQLTIRVSGYAVRFNALTKEQQQDVISRTFTQTI